jgi:hypothetical protein
MQRVALAAGPRAAGPEPIRSSGWALRFEARYGEKDRGGLYHSEVWNTNIGSRGNARWFGWSTYVPLDWQFDDNEVITHQVMQYQASSGGDEPAALLAIEGDRWYHKSNYDDPKDSDGRARTCWSRVRWSGASGPTGSSR